MSLTEDLAPFAKELTLFRQNNTLPQGEVKDKLAHIYEANWNNNKRWGSSRIDRGCPSCVSDMMKPLCEAWFDNQVEFKGVPVQRDLEEQIAEEERGLGFKDHPVMTKEDIAAHELEQLNSMSWGDFKKYCTSLGIKVKGKNKKQLLKELDA